MVLDNKVRAATMAAMPVMVELLGGGVVVLQAHFLIFMIRGYPNQCVCSYLRTSYIFLPEIKKESLVLSSHGSIYTATASDKSTLKRHQNKCSIRSVISSGVSANDSHFRILRWNKATRSHC